MRARTLSRQKRREIVSRIGEHLHPLKVILFGSYARGDYHAGSDVDLCVIVEHAGDWFQRVYEFKRFVDIPGWEIEPHIYTPGEFRRLLNQANPLVRRITEEGMVLYERQ